MVGKLSFFPCQPMDRKWVDNICVYNNECAKPKESGQHNEGLFVGDVYLVVDGSTGFGFESLTEAG